VTLYIRKLQLYSDIHGRICLVSIYGGRSPKGKPPQKKRLFSKIQEFGKGGCGVKVPSVELIHINKQFVRGDPGIVWSELLVRADVLLEAEERSQNIKGAITNQMAILARSEAPDVYPGKHLCQRPYKCNYWSHCTAGKPDDWINYLPAVR